MATQNDHSLVGILVERDGKILLVQESKPGRAGLYNVPGGHVEPHETLLEAAVRETKEESGYDIELTGLLGIYQSIWPDTNFSGPVFAAKVIGGSASASSAHPDVKWATLDEIRLLESQGKLFTTYPPRATESLLAGKILPLDAVICTRHD